MADLALFSRIALIWVWLLTLGLAVWAGQPFHPEKLSEIETAVAETIVDGGCPGGVFWFERGDQRYVSAFGNRAIEPEVEPMTVDTIFDAASLTKVVATTPSVMLLIERGQVRLDAPVRDYLDEFDGDGREAITIRQLLTHTSGLRSGIPGRPVWEGYERGITMACAETPRTNPATMFRYSDVNFILLGEVVRRVSGQALDEFAAEEVFRPLKMRDTSFRPSMEHVSRVAPTTRYTNGVWRGVVHDPTARRMGGVAGHAGIFTTAADLARYARMLLNGGELEGVRVLRTETVKWMTSVQSPENVRERRGLGWDIDSPYAGPRGEWFPVGSYGHTGWTGGSLWVDPFSRSFVMLLSNRNHPTEEGSVIRLRHVLGTLAAEAIPDFNFVFVPDALPPLSVDSESDGDLALKPSARPELKESRVLSGIDVLVRDQFEPLRGLRVGLITNHTGHDRDRSSTIDLLHRAGGVMLKALFSPEHGIRGVRDEQVDDGLDEKTGLPVYSLYGERRQPSAEQLVGLDALVFDIQDVGCRFYTYISTMGLCMKAAGDADLLFFVLDRPNPIGGLAMEGPVYDGESQFVAFHSLPLRHGMTVGELGRMFATERDWSTQLTVIRMEGYRRELWWDETGLPWTNPSPNMRNLKAAILYPGVGLVESALAVGRGTDTPFEVVGAPYANDAELAQALNSAQVPGVRFVPIRFTPAASTFAGQSCAGVYIMLTDRDALNTVDLGLTLITTFQRLYPQNFDLDRVRGLLRDEGTLTAVKAGKRTGDLKQLWAAALHAFGERRKAFLLYD
jgi:uncharacterized protein YbbC (DUF1343 family)/CubicO group peptidase (beta-lactamase class C family)